jgi:hypothetical protein
MEDLKRQFQEETKLSFDDIPINGVHLEYINWLEKRIEALSLGDVVGQSEQLKAFAEWVVNDNDGYIGEYTVGAYLESL